MTKYVLAGGYVRKAPDGGKAFVEELVKDFPEPVKVLDCVFARLKDRWSGVFEEDRQFFSEMTDRKFEMRLATLGDFVAEVAWADVVYFRGGFSHRLVELLNERSDWKTHIEGKTLAGTSAGADALGTYYYGLDTKEVREGTGLLPVKVISHFKSDYHGWEFDWDKAEAELKAYKEDLPLALLAEGEFKVFQQ
jgi:peptidase E